MPRAPRKCNSRGCFSKATFRGRCDEHQPIRIPWQKKEPPREFLKTKEWTLQRRRVLYRDNTFNGGCQLKLDKCTIKATSVDHKVPVWYSGEERVSDEELQGLCFNCHQKKSSYEGVQAKRIKGYLNGKVESN